MLEDGAMILGDFGDGAKNHHLFYKRFNKKSLYK